MKPKLEPLAVSPAKAGELLDIPTSTMYLYIQKGKVPSITVGGTGRKRVPMDFIRKTLEQRNGGK